MLKRYFLLFLLTINNIFPFDKISIVVLDVFHSQKNQKLDKSVKIILLLCFVILIASFLSNIGASSLRIFYPLLFLYGACIINTEGADVKKISYLFLPNICFGIFGIFYSLFSGFELNSFVVSSAGKSIIFPICATGFSPTPQVYGTFCVLYL